MDNIFVVGNSWSMSCDEAPYTAFDILGLKERWEVTGITLDAQAEYIINNQLVNNYRIIWLVGHHWRADPKGNGDYILPYPYEGKDPWDKLTRSLWFKKFTKKEWYWRTNALFVKAVLADFSFENLLMIPIYHPSIVDHDWIKDSSCIWNYKLRDFAKNTNTLGYAGHMTYLGHEQLAPVLRNEIFKRWNISLPLIEHTLLN